MMLCTSVASFESEFFVRNPVDVLVIIVITSFHFSLLICHRRGDGKSRSKLTAKTCRGSAIENYSFRSYPTRGDCVKGIPGFILQKPDMLCETTAILSRRARSTLSL